MYNSAVALDQLILSQAGHDAAANNILAALSGAALFGIRQSLSAGLLVTFYGGPYNIAGTPTILADQAITLTASTTNYVYNTAAGVVTKTTSIPSGWPGPLAAGAVALYDFVTAASTILSGHCWRTGLGIAGPAGIQGVQGNPGTDLAGTRKRFWTANGGGSTALTAFGWDVFNSSGTQTARTLATTTLRESIPYSATVSPGTAGSMAYQYSARNWCWLGNAAGRGGFSLAMRFCFESGLSPATQACFWGVMPAGAIGNVEPDTLLNCAGIGAKRGDANLSFIHNDASGTATVSALAIAMPARATDNVYELVIASIANSGVITYSITNLNTGDVNTGSASSDIPSNTTFLSHNAWISNGTTASAVALGLIQVVGETRY